MRLVQRYPARRHAAVSRAARAGHRPRARPRRFGPVAALVVVVGLFGSSPARGDKHAQLPGAPAPRLATATPTEDPRPDIERPDRGRVRGTYVPVAGTARLAHWMGTWCVVAESWGTWRWTRGAEEVHVITTAGLGYAASRRFEMRVGIGLARASLLTGASPLGDELESSPAASIGAVLWLEPEHERETALELGIQQALERTSTVGSARIALTLRF